MRELSKKRLTAFIGVLLAAISASPLATNLAILGQPVFTEVAAGIAGAGFLLGYIMAFSIFQKNNE
jgi:hypothetical protein